ncbi:MAG: transglutaminase family protein [Candidatus Nezhaarchaeota archaeon]|nr:transglutaminase family protein [Candidatus Nezhaarchaeota archaeon]MCX8142379.1 transglutaminase family protein [Candidatus Nezhaarchaeota archaeon]
MVKLAKKLTNGLKAADAIKSVYFFVRDYIKWTIEGVKPAIKVLESKKGACFNKASLQIALLRAASIPARYRLEEVRSDVLKPYLPADIYKLLAETIIHVLAEVYVNGMWMGCDATLDFQLSHPQWKRDWELGLDLSCIPSIYRLRILGTYPDLPVNLLLKPFENIINQEGVTAKIEEHLDKIRAMTPDEKFKLFLDSWGPNVVSILVRGRIKK